MDDWDSRKCHTDDWYGGKWWNGNFFKKNN